MNFLSTAVRRGRYTHQVKVKNIMEAKRHIEKGPYSVPKTQGSKAESNKMQENSTAVLSPSGSSSIGSPSSTSSGSSVTVNGIAMSTNKGSTRLSTETRDILAEAIQAHGLVDDDNDFEYSPETFDSLEMDVRSQKLTSKHL